MFPNLNDAILKNYIESVFDKYDTDKSGGLDAKEMTVFFNDLFKTLGIPSIVDESQALTAILSMDQNSDGTIDKKQLFDAFKILMNKNLNQQQQQQQQQQHGHPQYYYPHYQAPYQVPYQSPYQSPFGYAPNPYVQPNYGMYQPQTPTNPPPQNWPNDPMMGNIQSPYTNTNNVGNGQKQHMQNSGGGMANSGFGGGWSKRYRPQ